MNIKGIPPIFNANPVRAIEKVKGGIKSDESHDREGNGQQSQGDPNAHREPMTEEEFTNAVEYLKNIPGIKEHHWLIEPTQINGRRYILVKDTNGQIIRRINEHDLLTLPLDGESPTGNLLKKVV